MALGDCPKCWETICVCGYEYEKWTESRKQELRDALGPSQKEKDLQARLAKAEELNRVYESALEEIADPEWKFTLGVRLEDKFIEIAETALAAKTQMKENKDENI